MNVVTTYSGKTARKIFALAVAAYLVAWAATFVFALRVFGIGSASGLSLILFFPFAAALRIAAHWHAARGREFAFLIMLLIVVSGAVVGLVHNWYETGMDQYHAEDLKYAAFGRLLHDDPAFRHVKISVEGYHVLYIRGRVASQVEIDRLEDLASRHDIHWNNKLEIASRLQ